MNFIELKNVSKIYEMGNEKIHALDKIDLCVQKGEYISITGPSGCGKSTLMNIIGFLDQPTIGDYFYQEQNVARISDSKASLLRNQELGIVFQSFNLLNNYNILKNVELPLIYSQTYQKMSKKNIRDKAMFALKEVEIEGRWKHLPSELSGGQRQRTAIARAIVNRPKILLADEPTGNLDSRKGREILDLFEKLNAEGMTLIMVTHDEELAKRSSRQIKMLDGKIIEDDYVHT